MIEACQLPVNERVYLKKDWAGWRVVYPIRNTDGRINWFNLIFGGKRNLAFLIVLLILIFLWFYGTWELISDLTEIAEDPCGFCNLINGGEQWYG